MEGFHSAAIVRREGSSKLKSLAEFLFRRREFCGLDFLLSFSHVFFPAWVVRNACGLRSGRLGYNQEKNKWECKRPYRLESSLELKKPHITVRCQFKGFCSLRGDTFFAPTLRSRAQLDNPFDSQNVEKEGRD
jgi:hypothetical protein